MARHHQQGTADLRDRDTASLSTTGRFVGHAQSAVMPAKNYVYQGTPETRARALLTTFQTYRCKPEYQAQMRHHTNAVITCHRRWVGAKNGNGLQDLIDKYLDDLINSLEEAIESVQVLV